MWWWLWRIDAVEDRLTLLEKKVDDLASRIKAIADALK